MVEGKKGQIRCGGGILSLDDGSFTFFLELFIEDKDRYDYECDDSFSMESEAERVMVECMTKFPQVVKDAITSKDMSHIDRFCREYLLVQVTPYDGDAPPQYH